MADRRQDKPIAHVLHAKSLQQLTDSRTFARGEQYFKEGRVRSLRAKDGKILATVAGKSDYESSIWVKGGSFAYSCSCPHGSAGFFCKHNVAAMLAWAQLTDLAKGSPERAAAAAEEPAPDDAAAEDEPAEGEPGDAADEDAPAAAVDAPAAAEDEPDDAPPEQPRAPAAGCGEGAEECYIRRFLEGRDPDELINALLSLARGSPAVRRTLLELARRQEQIGDELRSLGSPSETDDEP